MIWSCLYDAILKNNTTVQNNNDIRCLCQLNWKDKKSVTGLLEWRLITPGYENSVETWQLCGLDMYYTIFSMGQIVQNFCCSSDLWYLDFSLVQFWRFKVNAFDLTFTLKYKTQRWAWPVHAGSNFNSKNQEMHSKIIPNTDFPASKNILAIYIEQCAIVIYYTEKYFLWDNETCDGV